MITREIQAKSILRKYKRIDSWFVANYGMNLYRGCTHNCVYCDGRTEGYYVSGEFGQEVEVKINAPELLAKELNPERRRIPLKRGFILPGGGVGDSYQPIESKYFLTGKALEIINRFDFAVHMLTKSTLVERDVEILKEINQKRKTIISFSFSSTDNKISKIFEPNVSLPIERLNTISKFKKEGITCGMFLMPVIPFITDTAEIIEQSIIDAKNAGADFVIFSGMTLKQGTQKKYFVNVLKEKYPDLTDDYNNIYKDNKWGSPDEKYSHAINLVFDSLAIKHKVPKRIPAKLFKNIIDQNDLVTVILDQMDYLLKIKGEKTLYGYAAYSVSQLKEPVVNIRDNLTSMKGVGKVTEKIILEILETGTSSYYERLLV